MSEGNQSALTPKQLKRLGRGLRPATAKSLKFNSEDLPYTDLPGYRKQCRFAHNRLNAHVNHNNRRRKAAQTPRSWVVDSEDGAALARSNIWLPSDGCRQKPRLERQEAFRVPEVVYTSDVVESDADLYRMGLLYDDEHCRGSGFNLNTIVHSDLVYEVRPSKRARNAQTIGHNTGAYDIYDEDGSLILDQFLASATKACSTSEYEAAPYPTPASTPLHVIHELADGMAHSLALPPAADNFPELISDLEGEEDCNGWSMVPRLRRMSSDLSTVTEDFEENAGAVRETWIVLGET